MKRLQLLHIIPSYKPAYIYGGPTVSVSSLCENQVALGHHVTVYTTTANGKNELNVTPNKPIEVDGVEVFYFNRITKDHTHISPGLLFTLWKNAKQFDVIHIHSWWNLLVILVATICYLRGIKPIVSPRGMLTHYTLNNQHSIYKKIIHRSIGLFLLKRTTFHATTESELIESQELFKYSSSFILPNIVTFPVAKKAIAGNNNDYFKIIFLSRIDPKKGLELLFESLSMVEFQYKLIIAGEGKAEYIAKLQKLASGLKIDENILWVGWKSGDEKYKLLAQADLFVLTSYNENFANVVLESLSTGTAVLISKQVGLYSYIERTKFGWVCELTSKSIKENLELAYTAVEERERTSRLSPLEVREDFAGEKLAQEYILNYKALK